MLPKMEERNDVLIQLCGMVCIWWLSDQLHTVSMAQMKITGTHLGIAVMILFFALQTCA